MSLRRHSRLSSSSLSSKPVRRLSSALSDKAKSLTKSLNASRKIAKQQRANQRLEKREISKFLGMAKAHCPDNITDMSENERWSLMFEYLIATVLRASCTSKRDIESIVIKVLSEMNNSDIYKDPDHVSQLNERVVKFLLGEYHTPMVSTLGPSKFDQTKALKKLLYNDFAEDPEFTSYEVLSANKKAYSAAALSIRQKASEKVNSAIYKIFDSEGGAENAESIYEKQANRTITDFLKEYSFREKMPKNWVIEREYGLELVQNCKADEIVSDWAASYGVDMPNVGVEDGILGFVSNRAIHKGKQPINYYAEILISKLQRIRGANDTVDTQDDSDLQNFPFSQPLMDPEDDLGECGNEFSFAELTEPLREPSAEPSQVPKPSPKNRTFSRSDVFESDDDIEVLESPEKKHVPNARTSQPVMVASKPRLPYMDRKRKRKYNDSGRKQSSVKKSKEISIEDFMDGLPELEPMTQS